MIHLLICPEFPPGAGGGIGTYASNIAQILARRGETVHVIGPLVKQAREPREQAQDGRLIIHRFESAGDRNTHPSQAFAWEAARLAEHLVETAGIEIIEAQEYQAPLYYFLKRRAEGFGPATKPPVVVHLHSPTELIARHNDWPLERPDLRSAAQREEYCIRSADALLSPSRLLAGAVEERYGLEAASVKVIPYPLGEVEELPRDPRVWSAGSILFMGRLEPRKGALEWIEAARQAATEHPRLIFDFVGCNVLGPNRVVGWRRLQERIPVRQLRNFHFHGYQPHERALRCLGRARIAVVPSRWDNLPYTCLEAMASGLPVITTRQGGMAEIVEDGRSGWLIEEADVVQLHEAVERALETTPETLEAMGRQAAARVRKLCGDDRIADQQLIFRRRVVQTTLERSSSVAARRNAAMASTVSSDAHSEEPQAAAMEKEPLPASLCSTPTLKDFRLALLWLSKVLLSKATRGYFRRR